MSLVAMVVRDGLGWFCGGERLVFFPGVAALDATGAWSVGHAALAAPGLRLRLEDTDPEAYWTALAEGILTLRMVGAVDVVLGMGRPEYERIGEPLRQLVKGRLGGGEVVRRFGDHYALFSQPPWSEGGSRPTSEQTVLLRVGAAQVQALIFAGSKLVQQETWTPGWDEAVAFAGVRAGYRDSPRPDVHVASWAAIQEAANLPAVRAWGEQLRARLQEQAWGGGTLVITGPGSAALQPYLSIPAFTTVVGEANLEVKGLWNFVQMRTSA